MAERLDSYDRLPEGMREYMSYYGHHFSKPMYKWAVSMMKDRSGNKVSPLEKEDVIATLKRNNVNVENDNGYDIPYVLHMARSDYMGSSITDEAHLCLYVKDYIDDVDGYSSRAFDEFMSKLIAIGVPVTWSDLM